MSFVKGLDLGKSKFVVVIASSIYTDDFFVVYTCKLYTSTLFKKKLYIPTDLVTKLNSSKKSFGFTYATFILDIELS